MGSSALDRLRSAELTPEIVDGELQVSPLSVLTSELRKTIRAHRAEIRAEILREKVLEELGLVKVDEGTGLPDLSATEPAAGDQIRRLRELARHPAFGEQRETVVQVVEKAVAGGLTEAGAYELIGDLGRRIRERRQAVDGSSTPEGGTCRDCGRAIGPTSSTCGSCKRTRAGRELREPAHLRERARETWSELLEAVEYDTEAFVEDQLPTRGRVALEAIGGWGRLRRLREERDEGGLRRARTRFARAFVGASQEELQSTRRGGTPVK